MQTISLLGATGSIGRSAVDVIRRHPERWRVKSVAGGSRIPELVEAVRATQAKQAAVADPAKQGALRAALDAAGCHDVEALAGADAVEALAADPETDAVLQAIVGAAGVAPTFAAARTGKRLMLANKESVVCGGALLMKTVAECGAELFPVDSEHSAVFSALRQLTPMRAAAQGSFSPLRAVRFAGERRSKASRQPWRSNIRNGVWAARSVLTARL